MTYIKMRPTSTRLGNWMFQYAAALSKSDDGRVAFVLPDACWRPQYERYSHLWPDVKYVIGNPPEGVDCLDGYFQDWRLIDGRKIRPRYRCPARIANLIDGRYGELLKSPKTVSIHVRRGDYLTLPHTHPFVGKAYLRRAVALFESDSEFIVCSDDIPWCRRFFGERWAKGLKFTFVEGNEALVDLYLMSICRHQICSNSTFSWWAAYLNENSGKRVVFPGMWYGLAMDVRHPSELYFPGSEVVENSYPPALFAKAVLRIIGRKADHVVRVLRGSVGKRGWIGSFGYSFVFAWKMIAKRMGRRWRSPLRTIYG